MGYDYPSLTISDDLSVDFSHEFEGVASYGKAPHTLTPSNTHINCLFFYLLFICSLFMLPSI